MQSSNMNITSHGFPKRLTNGGNLTIGYCSRKIVYCFLEIFLGEGGQDYDGGRHSRDRGSPGPPVPLQGKPCIHKLKCLQNGKKTLNHFVREPNSENYLDLIFAAPLCEKIIIAPDTNYITSAIRKFMLDIPSPGSCQLKYRPFKMSTTGLESCKTIRFKLCKN